MTNGKGKTGGAKPRKSRTSYAGHSVCSKKRTLLKERIRLLEARVLGHEARLFELERYLDVVTTIDGVLTKLPTSSESLVEKDLIDFSEDE